MLRWVLLEKASVSALYSLTRDPSPFEREPGVPGRAVWLPPGCVSLACSSAPNRGTKRKRGAG